MWQTLESSKDFFRGNYEKVLGHRTHGGEITPFVEVASLVFLGKITEAELFLKQKKLSDEARMISRFFLATGYVRESRYTEAKQIIAENAFQFARSNHSNSLTKYFAYQGLAFYRFYCGRYRTSKVFAEKAAALAHQLQFPYGEALALDVLANASVHFGEVRRGLAAFKNALKIVQAIGSGGLSNAMKISFTKNEATFGISPDKSIAQLEKLQRAHANNTYSSAELNLELIRQLTLRGRVSDAQKLLDNTYDLVHKNNNRRQATTLNLRSAHIQFLQGESRQALHLIRTAKLNLHLDVDLFFLAQLTGLESFILKEQGQTEEAEKVTASSKLQLRHLNSAIHQRILQRQKSGDSNFRTGEDPLGDLMDRCLNSKIESWLDEVIELGYLNLLRRPFGIRPGERTIFWGSPLKSVLLVNRGDLTMVDSLSRIHRRILEELGQGGKSKEELVTKVWGYDYHPGRHDGLLYSAMKELRKKIGDGWITLTESGYQLQCELRKISAAEARPAAKREIAATNAVRTISLLVEPTPLLNRNDLNLRQLEMIEALISGKQRSWTQSGCRQVFDVSTMTATRDLTDLTEKNLLRRLGKGRATCYVLGELPKKWSQT